MVKDFRPISLIGSLYKIIAKLLANRLMSVMGNLVNEVQSAFIASRQIFEGPFILNQIIHWCKAKKKQSMIFKVDFEKAFDSVRWDFLDDVLKKFGFGSRWCTWIQSCLKSSRGSIRVNGSPTPEFQFYKGLKQGDPLSPFLFILVMEILHLSFQNVVDVGLFKGVALDSSLQLSQLFYADDVVFIGQWCDSNLTTIIRVLDCFFRASGLRINLHKSKLMGIAVENSLVDLATNGIGCMTHKLPFQYLGVNIGVPIHVLKKLESIRIHFFNGVDLNVRKMTISVAAKMAHSSFGFSLRSIPRGGIEQHQIEELLSNLDGLLLPNMLDRWFWLHSGDGDFSVSSTRNFIDDKTIGVVGSKTRWCKYVPIKVNILSWRIKMDNLPTRLNLSPYRNWRLRIYF
ncbi:RNA-directed DNA polymerase, eukaryota [Tanacetum coccineum]